LFALQFKMQGDGNACPAAIQKISNSTRSGAQKPPGEAEEVLRIPCAQGLAPGVLMTMSNGGFFSRTL
jgi:hypothetical protein